MTANLLLSDPMHGTRPACWNREPVPPVRTRYGVNQDTGEIEATVIRDDWGSPGCATWKGVGVGKPTPEYPTGTPFPIAHQWDCAGCRWLPEGVR